MNVQEQNLAAATGNAKSDVTPKFVANIFSHRSGPRCQLKANAPITAGQRASLARSARRARSTPNNSPDYRCAGNQAG